MPAYTLANTYYNIVGREARAPVLIAFLLFIALALLWLFAAASTEEEKVASLYAANRSLTPFQAGLALAGGHISIITMLSISGVIALFGYDGFTFARDSMLSLGVLLLLSYRLRNAGCYTLGDVFGLRAKGTAPRITAAVITLAVALPLLGIQLLAAGTSSALLIGLPGTGAEAACTILIGSLVTSYAALAGMRGNTHTQISKLLLVFAALLLISVYTLSHFDWHLNELMNSAVSSSTAPGKYLTPGMLPHDGTIDWLDRIGLQIVIIVAAATAPHMLMQINTTQTAVGARRAVRYAIAAYGAFTGLLLIVGFGAAAVVGGRAIRAARLTGESSLLQLASGLHPVASSTQIFLVTLIACVVILTVLATVASVTFAAASSLAHDLFMRLSRRGTEAREVQAVRWSAIGVGVMGISCAVAVRGYATEFLASFSYSVTASCVFPATVYSLFWRRFNRSGLLWSVYGAFTLCVVLTVFCPTVSGSSFALWPHFDFAWFPLKTTVLVSMPVSFLIGWLGSRLAPASTDEDRDETAVKILAGVHL